MPMQRHLYPDNWEDMALSIKQGVNWICQGCGRRCRKKDEDLETFQKRIGRDIITKDKPGRYTLTVAHLDHNPSNNDAANLKALCTVCHCRYDIHPSSMAQKRKLKRERFGQLVIDFGV